MATSIANYFGASSVLPVVPVGLSQEKCLCLAGRDLSEGETVLQGPRTTLLTHRAATTN